MNAKQVVASGWPVRSQARSRRHETKSGSVVGAAILPTMTKQAQMIAMLREDSGISIATLAAAAGWQRHSIRGFFAAVVKKRFGFDLTYRKDEGGERLYRIEL